MYRNYTPPRQINKGLESIVKNADYYVKKYIRKRNEPNPSFPVPFEYQDYETIKNLIHSLNTSAVELSSQKKLESFKQAYQLFLKAEKLGLILSKKIGMLHESQNLKPNIAKLRSLTYNNLGCYFKSKDKLVTALEYLEKALRIEKQAEIEEYEIATTYLNVCAVLSKLNRHEEALIYSEEAVVLLEKADEEDHKNPAEMAKALSTAYHNYAVELEFMKRIPESKILYEKAYETSRDLLGDNDPNTQSFRAKLNQFQKANGKNTQESLKPSLKSKSVLVSPNVYDQSLIKDEAQSERQSRELIILAQNYRNFYGQRHKIIILDKQDQSYVKILVIPKSKVPILRLSVPYTVLNDILSINIKKSPLFIKHEELARLMEELMDLLYIENNSLQIHGWNDYPPQIPSKNNTRPSSAHTKLMTVTTEKSGAKYSVTMAVNEDPKQDTWKQKYVPSFELDEQM